jgi:hypothetical protein
VEHEISKLVDDSVSEVVTERKCPDCGSCTSFITVHTLSARDGGFESADYFRCLKYLKLFQEELREVVEHENKG